jgi:amino acid adenylation domain-containing protein
LEQAKVTVLNQTPSAFRQLMHYEMSLDPPKRRSVPLRYVIFGGEALDLASLIPWFEWHGDTSPKLINMYGITETTVHVTYRPLTIDDARAGTGSRIGIAIPHLELHVLDRHLKPVPIGVPGELFVGGDGLARGYLNRPELTAQKFIPHPFSATPDERLYRTGDLVRYTSDGDIEYLGRIDHQVKLRGFRVELGEIESVLAQHPAVREAVALIAEAASCRPAADHEAGPNVGGWTAGSRLRDKRLVAYVICGEDVADSELRGHVRERLPEYMVPAAFVRLDAFPLTANGKLDRRALPKPEWTRRDSDRAYIAPGTETEAALARIWQDVLGVKQAGLHDSFFDLGGHSLLATQVVSRVRDLFHVELSVRVFFESPSLESVAKAIDAEAGREALAAPPITPVPRDKPLPCSYAEESLWFLEGLSGGFSAYNIPLYLRLRGRLDGSILRRSLLRIVSRHEVLRTRFASSGGRPYQEVLAEGEIAWFEEDLTDLPSDAEAASCRPAADAEAASCRPAADLREMEALRRAEAASQRPFDLGSGPLLRGTLCRLAPDKHILCLVIHHIVFDGWSVGILLHELEAHYEALSGGNEAPLPPLAIQYGDYAAWQREWFSGESLERSLAYWRERLRAPLPALELPTDHARPAVQTFRGGQVSRRMNRDLTEQLRAFSRQESVTLFVTLLSGWGILLHRYTGQEDLVTGSAIAGRTRAELDGLIGFFVNTLALRLDLSGAPDFRTLLRRMQQLAIEAYEHQDTPFEALVAALQPERDLSRSPLFQVLFVFHNTPAPAIRFSGIEGCVEEVHNGSAKFDLTFAITDHAEGLWLALEYNADLFEAPTIERMLGHFQTLLEGIVANPDARLADLPFLTPQERHQLLVEWNDTRIDFPQNACLHQLFEEQTERTPNAVALVFGEERLTYRELNNLANRLARRLIELGTGPESLVGIYLTRSVEMLVALFATLKAGGAYVPLDPAYPAERLRMMLEDAQVTVVLTQGELVGSLPPIKAEILCLDREREVGRRLDGRKPPPRRNVTLANPASRVMADNLAYVIYTSGSTGKPKGVAIEHRSACAFVHWAHGVFDDRDLQGVLGSTSICFDLSVFEVFVPLSRGGSVILTENILALPSLPAREEVTLINTVPSAMAELARQGVLPSSVRTVNLAGEPLRPDLVDAVYDLGAGRVFDLYGPTESTTYSTFVLRHKGGPMTVGRPVANTRVYILDAYRQPAPIGVPGELYLGGQGLARGYLNRPELTAEKFIPDPFSGLPGERLYRTGDLARYRPDGNIEVIGRLDHQVKVRGFRIELGEIESVLSRHQDVQEAVVLAREDVPGDKRLVGYVILRHGQAVDAQSLRAFLREQLPDYMVPSLFVALDAFPLTPNGKVNRRALPAPEENAFAAGAGAKVEPRTDVERALADIWRELLKIERLGIHDDFFGLGGHSLLATQVVSRVRDSFQLNIPLRRLFEAPTIAGFGAIIEEALLEEIEKLSQEDAVRRLSEGPAL